jgi:hypothetical protein
LAIEFVFCFFKADTSYRHHGGFLFIIHPMKTTPFLDSKNIVAITRDTIDTFEPSLIRAYKEVFNASAWQE